MNDLFTEFIVVIFINFAKKCKKLKPLKIFI